MLTKFQQYLKNSLTHMKSFFFFALLFFFACGETTTPTANKQIDYQGHRGARGLFPENSITGLVKALDFPIQTLELDVVVSQDSQLILSHEPWFSHVICQYGDGQAITEAAAETLKLIHLDYKDIKSFDCGSRGNPRFPEQKKLKSYKPSFMDAISNVELHCRKTNRTPPHYNVELKSQPAWYDVFTPQPKKFVQLALQEIALLEIEEQITLQSFDPAILNEIHRQAPNISTSFLVENIDGLETNLKKLNFVPNIYSPYFKLLNVGAVNAMHQKGMKVIPWTINDPVIMKKLIEIGVDGIITDYPNLIP